MNSSSTTSYRAILINHKTSGTGEENIRYIGMPTTSSLDENEHDELIRLRNSDLSKLAQIKQLKSDIHSLGNELQNHQKQIREIVTYLDYLEIDKNDNNGYPLAPYYRLKLLHTSKVVFEKLKIERPINQRPKKDSSSQEE